MHCLPAKQCRDTRSVNTTAVDSWPSLCMLRKSHLSAICRGQNDDGSKAIQGRSRPARNKTKKVTGGATDEELAEHAARPRPFRPPPPKQMQRSKAKGRANSSKIRVGKNINDAAEALLGMGIGFVDDDMMVSVAVLFMSAVA